MKKILTLALALGATALLACPMQGGMGLMNKCQCDTSKLPKPFKALKLSDEQKVEIQKIREEGKEFHNKQHDKMMAVLTPEQLKQFEANAPKGCKSGLKMPAGGMGCKNCDKK
jgi:Spy/CpxP family protein refolding chaperone